MNYSNFGILINLFICNILTITDNNNNHNKKRKDMNKISTPFYNPQHHL